MPKVPSKPVANVMAPVKKKVAKKPDVPKVVFKKGVTDIVEVLAIASDLEGLWPKDLVRFPDLRSKYGFPEKISDSTITRAKLRHREHIRELMATHGPKREQPVVKVATKKKTPGPDKSVALKKKGVKKTGPVAKPNIGVSVMGPVGKPVGKTVSVIKASKKVR